jgi:YD repeat-containing protein
MANPHQSNQLSLAEKNNPDNSPTGIYVWFYQPNEDYPVEEYLSMTNRKIFKVKNKSFAYYLRGNWSYLSKTIKREFRNGLTYETYVKNYYDDAYLALPTRIEQVNNKGELTRSELGYSARSELVTKVDVIGTDQVVNAQWVAYEQQGNKMFPKDIYFAESATPFPKSQLSSKYVKRATYSYNFTTGNLVEYSKTNDVNQSFLWSKDNQELIAEAQGTAATNLAYTSFENGSSEGNWSFNNSVSTSAKTGLKSHLLNGQSIIRNSLQSTTQYVVTYWAKDGTPSLNGVQSSDDDALAGADGWRFYKKIISGVTQLTITGTGSTLIDELRLSPVGVPMTSYVYDDRYGVTHSSDANGNVSTYVYEDTGRLKMVKDNKGNILKHNVYNYQSQ